MKRHSIALVALGWQLWSCSSAVPGDVSLPGGSGGPAEMASGAAGLTEMAPGAAGRGSGAGAFAGGSAGIAPGASGSAGRDSSAGAAGLDGGGTTDTSGCPVWPQARLMPHVGAFFYGPDPGPCSFTSNIGNQTYVFTYMYEAGKLRGQQQTIQGILGVQSTSVYGLDAQGRLESVTTGTDIEVFEYGADYVLDTVTRQDGTISSQVRFTLSSTGYPVSASIGAGPGTPSRIQSYAYNNCRLVSRAALDPAGSLAQQLNYSYDGAGHVLSRLDASNRGDTYDYSCWR